MLQHQTQKRTTLITTAFYHIRSFLYQEEGTKYHDAVDIKTCSHTKDRDKTDY